MTFAAFLFIVTLAYAAMVGLVLFGLGRLKDEATDDRPTVSVVVAARDEAQNIEESLLSVLDQTYPADRFEVILVNDGSADDTRSIAERISLSQKNLRVVDAATDQSLRGKANALATGIEHATGEVILITDADCVVPRTWVEGTAQRYGARVGLVGGVTLQRGDGAFAMMQSLDWAYLLGMAASTTGLGYPLGSIGNNLSFRKAAYEDIGGYRKLKFSVTEDYTIVQAIIRTGKWRYLYPIDPRVLVESRPCPDIRSLARQKHRWGKGGLDMKLGGFFVMVIGFLIHTCPFVMLYWGDLTSAGVSLMAKLVMDYILLYEILRRLGKVEQLKYFYSFELYFFAYVVALPFMVFFGGKVRWKGRAF